MLNEGFTCEIMGYLAGAVLFDFSIISLIKDEKKMTERKEEREGERGRALGSSIFCILKF